jgi:Flp pilus assembly CpaF family ATPase
VIETNDAITRRRKTAALHTALGPVIARGLDDDDVLDIEVNSSGRIRHKKAPAH